MKKTKQFLKEIWQDESGQGTAEYVLLLVVIVAIAALFRDQIRGALETKLNELNGQLQGFSGN